jgi:hypothetical protein|nr:tetratricopeptide repeat protein [Kofleriaceae bacterium]
MRPYLLLPLLALSLTFGRAAHADDRADARTHYQSGVKLYNGGDYKGAIQEFSSAQQLLPADLNNYNLALCYDKLGDAEPAIKYYRAYLNAVPNTDKRAEIEASVNRLDAALKSASQKKTDDEAAVKAKADADAKAKADADRAAAEHDQQQQLQQQVQPNVQQPTGAGSSGAPTTGQVQPTGDAQLDAVQGVDIGSLRSQRGMGVAGGQVPAQGQGQVQGQGQIQANGQMQMNSGAGAPPPNGQQVGQQGPMQTNPAGQPLPGDKPAQAEPVYKKWWFWVVVGVSAYVVYEIASDNSQNQVRGQARESAVHTGGKGYEPSPGGFTLLRW